jgi:hypothetical protein
MEQLNLLLFKETLFVVDAKELVQRTEKSNNVLIAEVKEKSCRPCQWVLDSMYKCKLHVIIVEGKVKFLDRFK